MLLPGGTFEHRERRLPSTGCRFLPLCANGLSPTIWKRPPALRSFQAGRGSLPQQAVRLRPGASCPASRRRGATAIADYILLYRSKANLMMERDKEALEGFRLLEKQFPESPLLQDALLGQCQALLKLKDAAVRPLGPEQSQAQKELRNTVLPGEGTRAGGTESRRRSNSTFSTMPDTPKPDSRRFAQRNLLALSPAALKGKRSYTRPPAAGGKPAQGRTTPAARGNCSWRSDR